ncbi:MAG: gliding motility-associated ABC transporter substrate-binding protein GldG [Dysgonomonas sp.]
MKALVLKELKSIFCSPVGTFFALVFLLITGATLWLFSGSYNFIDNGYADMRSFFWLASILFIVLIPALTMGLFAEERRNKTLEILISRPIGTWKIYLSKFISIYIFVITVLVSTIVYAYSLYQLSYPEGNIEIKSIIASYISLMMMLLIFISVGLLGSAITKNQIVAFIISLLLSLFIFYGFDLFSGLFNTGKLQLFISSLGLAYHYDIMQRGIIQLSDVLTVANYLILFMAIALLILDLKPRVVYISLLFIVILNVIFIFAPNMRFDFTKDKRFTLSRYTLNLLESIEKDKSISVEVFLNGELNQGFQKLNNSVNDLLSDYISVANGNVFMKNINPYQLMGDLEIHKSMDDKGMPGIMLNEKDREGKISRKLIYPYARVSNRTDTLIIPLLKNIAGNTAEENLNASMEGLEYEFTDAIRLLSQKEERSIAFVEGHGELPRSYVYDAEELLSKYYSVNRGQIGGDVGVLDNFDAVIIAGPLKKYSETEKYILDQYIMSGGKVLWLIDGVFYSYNELAATGHSASMKNDVNLDDMLFTYGLRINPDLIQDKQSSSIYLVADDDHQSASLQPNFYQPLLMPSPTHPVTNNIRDVKSGFVSSIDIVNNSAEIISNILLTSSANAHRVKVPEIIDFDIERIQNSPNYFNEQFIPVAVSLEGKFNSIFTNRPIPDSINSGNHVSIDQSKNTKMIAVSSSDVITNEIQGRGKDSQVLPMGYDRVSQIQYGNRDFILNAVNWLTGDDELMALRTKKQQLYMLNKQIAYEERNKYVVINICFPVILILLMMGSVYVYRKRKYEK